MNKKNPFSVPEEYFERSRAEILSKISGKDESVFFDAQRKSILAQTTEKQTKVISIRRVATIVAAASIFGLGMFLFQNGNKNESTSFETLLANTPISEEDLLLEVSEEDFVEYVGDNIAMISFTDNEKAIDLNNNSEEKIKPNESKESPSFEDIDEDVIIDYLLEDETFEIEL
ncbi:MAG: hypothetical protein R2809_05560 [Flavobacteriales bacterium]